MAGGELGLGHGLEVVSLHDLALAIGELLDGALARAAGARAGGVLV